jgi:hypothetical protein
MLLKKVVRNAFKIVSRCGSPAQDHSTPKHPIDASIHLCFLDEFTPISLLNAASNRITKATVLMNQPKRSIHNELLAIRLEMSRELRRLLRSHADFHSFLR